MVREDQFSPDCKLITKMLHHSRVDAKNLFARSKVNIVDIQNIRNYFSETFIIVHLLHCWWVGQLSGPEQCIAIN